jgi:hypothetical protein
MRTQRFGLLLSLFFFLPAITMNSTERALSGISETDRLSYTSDSESFDQGRFDRALQRWRHLPRASMFAPSAVGAVTGTVWKPLGPSPIVENGCCVPVAFAANGRVNSIAVDPTNPDVLYLGSAGGGVWKSVDGGDHWTPKTDQEISLGIGTAHALAVDPNNPNIIYAGTSSFALLDQSLPRPRDEAQSRGILKSTDGGASWVLLGSGIPTGNEGDASLFRGVSINTIIVDPADSNRLYLAAGRGDDPNFGGAYRSTDGGLHWTQGNGTFSMWVESLVLDTSSPPTARVLYAGAWRQGVLKSTDGGQSWTPVLTAATVAAAAPAGFLKTMVALAPPANPPLQAGPIVYVSLWRVIPPNSPPGTLDLALIFSNSNGGDPQNWVQRNAQVVTSAFQHNGVPDPLIAQGFSDMVVDPDSPGNGTKDLIYWGAGTQFLSTDSGDTFNEIGQGHGIHGDHQTWLVVPQAGTNPVYAGDDGGLWRSTDAGGSWTGTSMTSLASTINGGGLQIATLYNLAVTPDATASASVGAAQDSGMLRQPPVTPPQPVGAQPWSGTSNDGIDVVFDKITPNVAYSVQNGCDGDRLFKSTDSGVSWDDITACLCPPPPQTCPIPVSERGTFENRLAIDPSNTGYLYVGGSAGSVYRTTDGGSSFQQLTTPVFGNYIRSLDVAPGDPAHLVIAAGSKVFVTTQALDATVSFQDVTGSNLPSHPVTRVAFDPNDANVIYATLSGSGTGHVFRRTITQGDWTDISPPTLVDLPVNALALDGGSNPAILYVGTNLGVLRRSVADGAVWEVVDDLHLPNAAVTDLEINPQAGVLRAATWGRGVFELAAPSGPVISVAETALEFGPTCAVTGTDLSIHVSSVGTDSLMVTSVQRLAGSASFTVLPSPTTPVTIAPGGAATFTVHYTPTVPATDESAIIRISSNDPAVPFVDLLATGIVETTPPTITCPANVTAVAPVACLASPSAIVSFPAPVASDNCPGVTTQCVPSSGSSVPVGTTTVTCTATDAAGNTASCSFTVTAFDVRLQDDIKSATVLLLNSQTGEYRFCCGGTTFTGIGKVIRQGCTISLQVYATDRRVMAMIDKATFRGSASLQSPPGVLRCTITDRDIRNDSASCQ